MIREIDETLYLKMLSAGAARLSERKEEINDLNVFPIPDGDTGNNMLMTVEGGLSASPMGGLGATAAAVSRGMLLGARGNSGVILSRIFSGISKELDGMSACGVRGFGDALKCGVKESYGAVAKPVEGTILTVFREGVEYADSRITDDSDLTSYFRDLLAEFDRSLERTPELLAVLKESGVVDSGGAGLILIFRGMNDALNGLELDHSVSVSGPAPRADLDLFTENSVLEFGYCTEFLLRLQTAKTDPEAFDLEGFIDGLEALGGESVVAFREGTIVKVHVHTMRPGEVLGYCQRFGEFLTLKIENMTLQHNETVRERKDEFAHASVRKPFGIVAVASGEGIRDTFFGLGCDAVVEGGQSMNPSAEDILGAFRRVNADTVFVYPNNGNVILAAKQAAELFPDADVRIIPTRSVGEGYAAISMLDMTSGDPDTIEAEQNEIIGSVVTGMVSKAIRSTEKDGVAVMKDDYIGFVGDTILIDDGSRNDALFLLADKLGASRYDIMLVICGASVNEAEMSELESLLRARYRRTEIVMINGGQPVYDYILVLE